MEIDINTGSFQSQAISPDKFRQIAKQQNYNAEPKVFTDQTTEVQTQEEPKSSEISFSLDEFEHYLNDIEHMSETLNRQLKFNIDRDTDQVFVKIVNRNTDEVIRELPAEDLRNLHKKMKEAIEIVGLFVDEHA